MSTEETAVGAEGDEVLIENTPGYKTPAQRALSEIMGSDKDDEALEKYKRDLLGDVSKVAIVDETNPSCVIIKKMELVSDQKDGLAIDLTLPKEEIKKVNFSVKEGIQYRIRISFNVQREIVTGLKYVHAVKKMGVRVENETYMVGSYGPKLEMYEYMTPLDEMPTGMMTRGKYKVISLFTDDDGHEHLKWEWGFELKKDWESQ
jgi:Rho GDP-dissociation inhibitor